MNCQTKLRINHLTAVKSVTILESPFVGYLGKRFGLVTVTGIGCLLATIGIGACFLAEDIVTVILLWGIIYGLGFGMGTNLLPQILSQHFEEHMDKANGLTLGGGTIGSVLLPIIVDRLIVEYGTSGMFLILSGIILNGVPAALLLRKLDDKRVKSKKNAKGLTIANLEPNIETSGRPNRMSSEHFKISELQIATISLTNILEEDEKIESTYNEEPKYNKVFSTFSNENKKESEVQFTYIKAATENRNINLHNTVFSVQSESNLKENSALSSKSSYSKSSKCRSSSSPNQECASSNSLLVFLDITYIIILIT
ncbi:uncharacterized protein TNCV_8681 [Trichonephila clavipes]|nr:uncharacterized protein TNCV_8681 [Trichonephila clavipes]